MHADWTVACGADDPEVVVPWAGKDASLRYVDLRSAPDAIQEIPEATEYPCVAAALRRWNQPCTLLFTAKCDVWSYPAKLFDGEDLPGFAFAHGSYIDLLPVEPQIFSSFAACEQQLHSWTEMARSIALPASRCEWTLRPARVFPTASVTAIEAGSSPQSGFATTLYVWGYGASPQSAASAWAAALQALIEPVLTFSPS
ncbi:MAG: hypothetical protein ACLQMO_05350 [Acidobacteriaceae bacterium]